MTASHATVDLRSTLAELELSDYHSTLASHGFDTRESLLDITENDLQKLNFKLGHRRKLQRYIETARTRALSSEHHRRMSVAQLTLPREGGANVNKRPILGLSRTGRFTHPPRPDDDAPQRPNSAYKNFQTSTENELKSQRLSFIAIAQVTSHRWQALSIQSRLQDWLKPAAKALEEYRIKRKEYQNTDSSRSHQLYLEEHDRVHGSRHSDWAQERFEVSANSKVKRRYSATYDVNQSNMHTLQDECALAADVATGNLQEVLFSQPYSNATFPQKETTVLAVTAFFNGTGQRFHLWDREEALFLIEAVFNQNSQPDLWTLMELYAIAAVGSCCDADCFPPNLHEEYIKSCLMILGKCTERTNLRAMRLFLCLAFYCTLEYPHRSRTLSEAALLIGRLELQQLCSIQTLSLPEENDWRKVFRSVIFMESWLHYALGFPLRLSDDDTKTGSEEICGTDSSLEDIIQHQVNRIGLLAVDIAVNIKSREMPDVLEIKTHMEKLELWYRQLPPIMRIATLNSEQSDIFTHFQKRSVLLVHLMCLGAVTILHRPLLIAIAKSRYAGIWDLDGSREECRMYQDYCFLAAQQASRIAGLLRVDSTMPRRCWIAIFQSFSACSILLFSASQKLLYEPFGGFEQDLEYAENFIKLIKWCSVAGPVAKRCLDIVTPIHNELKTISGSYWLHSGSQFHLSDNFRTSPARPMGIFSDVDPPRTPSMMSPPGGLGSSVQPRINEEFFQRTRPIIITLVQSITKILLDPYSQIYGELYGANPNDSSVETMPANPSYASGFGF